LKKIERQNTALLYFTLTASEEARSKQFISANKITRSRDIAQQLIDHTHETLSSVDLPVIVYSSDRQVGETFGERFANAFATLFEEGYENVIAVGNDCPRLSSGLISRSRRSLDNNDIVLGPASDGGVYLLGLNRQAFDKESFIGLSWKTDSLLADLVEYTVRADFSFTLLEKLSDIDDNKDLLFAIRELGKSALFSLKIFAYNLAEILAYVKTVLLFLDDFLTSLTFLNTCLTLRAPPE